MDNQHRQITGYRELTQAEVDLMNEIKALGPQLHELCEKVRLHVEQQRSYAAHLNAHENNPDERERLDAANPELWLSWGRDGMKQCLMHLTRAVAQPTSF